MFRKLLNVGKGHASDKLQQQQQHQKNLFQLNEIRSYGFSYLCCLGYSPSLSLLAVGSKYGLLRILGNSSVEFSYQIESGNSIRQIELIDCRQSSSQVSTTGKNAPASQQSPSTNNNSEPNTVAKIVVLTDNGQLYLFALRTLKVQNFADNTTQTEANSNCCEGQNHATVTNANDQKQSTPEYTQLGLVGRVDYFKYRPEDENKSRRVTTLEVSADLQSVHVGTESGNLYHIPLSKFDTREDQQQQNQQVQQQQAITETISTSEQVNGNSELKEEDSSTAAVNLTDEPQIEEVAEPYDMIKFDDDVAKQLGDDIKAKKQGAIESIKRHPSQTSKLLISYHRGLNVIYDLQAKSVDKYFYHNQVLESSCFADQSGDFFYTSHNDGSYIKWDTRAGSQARANDDFLGQLYGPYPCKPTPKITACTGLVNDQLENLVIFSGGMPRATYDDKNPVTIVRTESDGKDTIKTVLDLTSKVLDFVVITRPRTGGAVKQGGGGKKNKQKQQQRNMNNQIAVALAILAEEEFVVIDLLNSDSYLEFGLPYLNCVHSSAITCNQHYSDIGDHLYNQILDYNKQQLKGKLSANEWPITGGKVIEEPELKSHDVLLTGHEDGSVNFWDVSGLAMRHLLHLSTARFFSTSDDDDDLPPIGGGGDSQQQPAQQQASGGAIEQQENGASQNEPELAASDASAAAGAADSASGKQDATASVWPPLKRVGRFDPYSDDARLAIRRLSLCPHTGTLVVAGTGGQVLVFELSDESHELAQLEADQINIVSDQRFRWKGHEKMRPKMGSHKFQPSSYKLISYVQLDPPSAATALDLRADWHLYALGTSYGFVLYDYANKRAIVNRCTLNAQDFAIVSGDATGTMSRKKSFRKSLRESFRRLRRGRSQRNQPQQPAVTGAVPVTGGDSAGAAAPIKPAFSRVTTGVRTLNQPSGGGNQSPVADSALPVAAGRNIYSAERQVEVKVELSSIVKCLLLTPAVITNSSSFTPSLWVGTNAGQVLVYAISLASTEASSVDLSEDQQESSSPPTSSEEPAAGSESTQTSAKLAKEIQLKHRAPIVAIFTSPEAPPSTTKQQQTADLAPTSNESSPKGSPEKSEAASDKSAAILGISKDEVTAAAATAANQQQVDQTATGGPMQQARVLICSEEQFKVFNLPSLKPFCKFKLTANEGLRAKKISITHFLKPLSTSANGANSKQQMLGASKSLQSFATQTSPSASPVPAATSTDETQTNEAKENNNNLLSALNHNKDAMNAKFGKGTSVSSSADKQSSLLPQMDADVGLEPYMVCMSNQGDCAIYSVPDLKRQAQIQVCKRDDVNGITSTMLTNYGEGFYLKSSSNFLRFSISTQRVLRVASLV